MIPASFVLRRASGVTLLEMLVTLTLLGLILGVAVLAVGSLKTPRQSQEIMDMREARTAAIRSGTRRIAHGVLFMPDGRAVGPAVDPLTGIPHAQ